MTIIADDWWKPRTFRAGSLEFTKFVGGLNHDLCARGLFEAELLKDGSYRCEIIGNFVRLFHWRGRREVERLNELIKAADFSYQADLSMSATPCQAAADRRPLSLTLTQRSWVNWRWVRPLHVDGSLRLSSRLSVGPDPSLMGKASSCRRFPVEKFENLNGIVKPEKHCPQDNAKENGKGEREIPRLCVECIKVGESGPRFSTLRTMWVIPIKVFLAANTALTVGEHPHMPEHYVKTPDTSSVDAGIRPLVVALNRIPQVVTRYSCHGHALCALETPFVIFRAKGLWVVQALHKAIQAAKTSYGWRIKARVLRKRDACDLFWMLSTSQKRTLFNGKRLDGDIAVLACALRGI